MVRVHTGTRRLCRGTYIVPKNMGRKGRVVDTDVVGPGEGNLTGVVKGHTGVAWVGPRGSRETDKWENF